MALTLHKSFTASYTQTETKRSFWDRFIEWADRQQEYCIGWAAATLTVHGCVLTIITVMAILLAGNPFVMWPLAIGAMAASLVVNLAALPTKITIPVFFISVVIDLVIIGICIGIGLSWSAVFP
jgi:hypothetical protein